MYPLLNFYDAAATNTVQAVSQQYHSSLTAVSHQSHISLTAVSQQSHSSLTAVSQQSHSSENCNNTEAVKMYTEEQSIEF